MVAKKKLITQRNIINQWYLKVTNKKIDSQNNTIHFMCGDDEELAREKEKQAKDRFGDTIETKVFFGNIMDGSV
jgi:hypothetical protein